MAENTSYLELRCPACPWTEPCGPEGMVKWLRRANKLRAGSETDPEIIAELFRAVASQFTCPQCGQLGLAVAPAQQDDAVWPGPTPCSSCGKSIPLERLNAVPGTTLCAHCQHDEELGRAPPEQEYCPRCGAPMQLQLSKSPGMTRYVMTCTACRQ